MASFLHLRPHRPSETSEGSRMFRPRLVAAALVLAAAVIAFGLSELASPGRAVHTQPEFLTRALGAPQPHASLVRSPAPDLHVAIRNGGFKLSGPTATLGLTADVPGGSWTSYRRGASRPTSFGRETVTLQATGAEHFLTVGQRQGAHTWRWLLDTAYVPRISSVTGAVGFFDGLQATQLAIDPVKILDGRGRDVTPKGSRWTIEQAGSKTWLALRLDDTKLPLPYTIDPTAALRTNSAAGNGTTAFTVGIPGTANVHDLLVLKIATLSGTAMGTAPSDSNSTANPWTLAKVQANGTAVETFVYYKWALPADVSAGNVTVTPPTAVSTYAQIDVYRGLDSRQGTTLATAAVGTTNSASKTVICPALTSTAGTAAATPELMFCVPAITTIGATGAWPSPFSGTAPASSWLQSANTGGVSVLSLGGYRQAVTAASTAVVAATSGLVGSSNTTSASVGFGFMVDPQTTFAPLVALSGSPTNAFWNGSNSVYVKGTSGTFTVAPIDPASVSGPFSFTYGAIASWTVTAGGVYTWSATPAASSTSAVGVTNNAATASAASTTLTATLDQTAPTTTVQFPANNAHYTAAGWTNGSAGCTNTPATS
ncbi:MAG: hypothetical protein QOI27_2244, partial [Gaiellaceae bacterium]|nr:hypothetical protein [Gaiellaceae bacterium]